MAVARLSEPAWPPLRFTPLLVALGGMLFALMIVAYHTELNDHPAESVLSKLAWRNGTVRPPALLVLIVAGWGVVVRVCRDTRLNVDHVLGGRLQPPAATFHGALFLLCIVVGAHLVHYIASETPGLTWRPWLTCNIALHLVLAFVGLTPAAIFYPESRLSLARTLYESVVAPCAPVTFWHVIVADYLTSLAKAFADIQVTTCITYHILYEPPVHANHYIPTSILWERHWNHCADTYSNAIMLALPFWWRLMQVGTVSIGSSHRLLAG